MKSLDFYNSSFIHLPLPCKNKGKTYSRSLGNGGKLILTSSSDFVPYGLYGRLALVAITNLAIKNTTLSSSDTLYSLLKLFRIYKPTGIQLSKFESQLVAFCNTLITISDVSDNHKSYNNLLLIEESSFKLNKFMEQDEDIFIKFSEKGMDFLKSNALPIPNEATKQLQSPYDFDILCWLIISIYQIRNSDKINIPWEKLFKQFNITAKNQTNFKKSFCKTLYEIQITFYPKAKISRDKEDKGLIIYNSPLLVQTKDSLLIPYFRGEMLL